jgi:hypothetical protein
MWPLVPYRTQEVTIPGAPEGALACITDLLKDSRELDRLFGAGESNPHRLSGHVDGHRFKLVVQPPRFWRIPYLPVVVGSLEGARMRITARPQVYELVFLPAWCAIVLAEGGPLWFALGVPAVYHLVGWGAFVSETDRVMELLKASCSASGRLTMVSGLLLSRENARRCCPS